MASNIATTTVAVTQSAILRLIAVIILTVRILRSAAAYVQVATCRGFGTREGLFWAGAKEAELRSGGLGDLWRHGGPDWFCGF